MSNRGRITQEKAAEAVAALERADGAYAKAGKMLGLSGSTVWRRVQWAKKHDMDVPSVGAQPEFYGTIESPEKLRNVLQGKRFVFTAAQNNTEVHKGFFASLLQFCKERGAELHVSPITYNKRGFQNYTKDDEDERINWASELLPYMSAEEAVVCDAGTGRLCDNLIWCGNLDILPTAVDPFSGLDSYSRAASMIAPHPKVQMQSVPTPNTMPAKLMYSTGAVTLRNYIQRKAGQKASFHHCYGALYVEIDYWGHWFVRQLVAEESGVFYDLTDKFTPDGVTHGHNVLAINWGDLHAPSIDPEVMFGAWDSKSEDSMVDTLLPRYQFLHDSGDFHVRNHHNRHDPQFIFQTQLDQRNTVENEVSKISDTLKRMERPWCENVVVWSNHDEAFRWWLRDGDYKGDPQNARYMLEQLCKMYNALEFNGYTSDNYPALKMALDDEGGLSRTRFLEKDESFMIGAHGDSGIECGMHGHLGPNGARGNPRSFRKIGVKCNIGHTHSAAIVDGVYVAGVSCKLDMGYNHGPSSWSHSHIVTYPNGKRTIITMRGKKWRA